jgi:two-component system, NtrC family, response regulator PilR
MKTAAGKILVVDDEPDLLTLYELALLREGLDVSTASTLAAARQALAENRYDLLVTDMRLPDGMGLELVQQLTQEGRPERAVVITAYGSADNAVQALKAGAFDYLTKPVDLQRFRMVVREAIQSAHAASASTTATAAQANKPKAAAAPVRDLGEQSLSKLVGESAPMVAVRSRVRKVAASMAPVLLQGESGTGKELVARAIHDCSHRGGQPFVAVNCGAIPETLLEAEFFGVKKGAYTGAQQDREGYFQVASGGTLFLDEIGDLPLIMQSKLLRAIQERCVRPIGGSAELLVDVRIVSASHKRLADEVQAGHFRKDLYYRLNVIELSLPPLRERRQDLLQLADVLMARIAQGSHMTEVPHLTDKALAKLQTYDFPGNVRELENILHRAMALSEGTALDLEDWSWLAFPDALEEAASAPVAPLQELALAQPSPPETMPMPDDLEDYLGQQERAILLQALQEAHFNRTAAAQRLGISLRQMRYRMERLNIIVPDGASNLPATSE